MDEDKFNYGQYAYFGVVYARETGWERVKEKKHGTLGWAPYYYVTRLGRPTDENAHKRVMVILDARNCHLVWVSPEKFRRNKELRRELHGTLKVNGFARLKVRNVKLFKADFFVH